MEPSDLAQLVQRGQVSPHGCRRDTEFRGQLGYSYDFFLLHDLKNPLVTFFYTLLHGANPLSFNIQTLRMKTCGFLKSKSQPGHSA